MILRGMLDLCWVIFKTVVDLFRPRAALGAEMLVLRQQIVVLRRGKPGRLPFSAVDRVLLGWVCHLFPKARGALAIVRPDTVVRCLLTVQGPDRSCEYVLPWRPE